MKQMLYTYTTSLFVGTLHGASLPDLQRQKSPFPSGQNSKCPQVGTGAIGAGSTTPRAAG